MAEHLKQHNQNDHDLLIELNTQMKILINEVAQMRDVISKDINHLQHKVTLLEKEDVRIESKVSDNLRKINELEKKTIADKNDSETSKTYWTRTIINMVIPFIFFIIGIALTKLGIINFNV